MYTDQVHFMYKQFQPTYSFFMAFNFPLENCLNMWSFELFICGHSAPQLCTGHILVVWESEHKAVCLVWSVLNEALVKKAENDSQYCSSWLGMSICHLTSISVLLICTFTTVSHNYLVLISTLCCLLDVGFHLWENAVEELELLWRQKFPHRKWRKPCISTFNHTSARYVP